MKAFIIISLFFTNSVLAGYTDEYLIEFEQSDYNHNQNQVGDKTKDALLSIDTIQERADYFVYKLKNLTFGEYADDVLIIAPLITGEVQFNANQFNLYYNHFNSKGGVRYKVTF